jgi:hypothetical protein
MLLPLGLAGCAATTAPGEPAGTAAQAPTHTAAVVAAKTRGMQSLPAPSAAEARLGLQLAHVGVTASGGLVDARFKVLDAVKVKALLANPANAPQLVASESPPVMAPHHALRGAKFSEGQIFYIMYPNTRSAIKPGVEVSVAMGGDRLGPVKAE